MKKRIFSISLAAATLLLVISTVLALSPDSYPSWPEMNDQLETIAVRVVRNGGEVSRLEQGDIFKVQFWINGIDPYAMVLPLSWDPGVVAMYDEANGVPVTSGKKTEGDVGHGFQPGAACYDNAWNWDYTALYWNGKPVYSLSEDSGYPYVDAENGHCRFFYYVDAATPSAQPQMFLELTFQALRPGSPNFHFSTSSDRVFDETTPGGLSLSYQDQGITTQQVTMPALTVIDDPKEETPVTSRPPKEEESTPSPTRTPRPTPTPTVTPTPSPEASPEPSPVLRDAERPDYFPYPTPTKVQAILDEADAGDGDYVLPESTLAAGINRLIRSSGGALLVEMPAKLLAEDHYAVSFLCANLDDMAALSNSTLYFETPYGYVGVQPGALLNAVDDSAMVTVDASPKGDGIAFRVLVDGTEVEGLGTPAFRVIVSDRGSITTPCVWSDVLFGSAYADRGRQPVPLSGHMGSAVVFVTPSAGIYQVENAAEKTFADVPQGYWGSEAISLLSSRGIVMGVSETAFAPEQNVTRAQLATLLTRTLGTYVAGAETGFLDSQDDYLYPFIASANRVGIIKGYSETSFGPGDDVTRQDMAVMVYRGLELLGIELRPARAERSFQDDGQISDYAREAVYALYRAGLINGVGNDNFDPWGNTTRAQAAQLLSGVYRLIEHLF